MVHSVALWSSFNTLSIEVPQSIIDALDDSVRSDLQHLSNTYFLWILASAFVVAIGVAMEGPEIFNDLWPRLFIWFTWNSEKRRKTFERRIKKIGLIGWLLVVLGVMGEFVFDGLQNRAEGELQTFNTILLTDARLTASSAKDSAIGAASASQRANAAAASAKITADAAKSTAGEARKEANSFENDIKLANANSADANEKAAKAVSELAGALQEAADARKELARIKSPRTLVGSGRVLAAIKPFAGTEYVLSVDADAETLEFAKILVKILDDAKWVRKQSSSSTPSLTVPMVFGDAPAENVSECIGRGVNIAAHSNTSMAILQMTPPQLLPRDVQASGALHTALALAITPPNEKNIGTGSVAPERGEGPIVICVGQKP